MAEEQPKSKPTIYKVSAMIKMAREVIKQFEDFLDEHNDIVINQPKGYLKTLQAMFNEEYDQAMTYQWILLHTKKYREKHNIPKKYCENKYYTSPQKQAALAQLSQDTAKEGADSNTSSNESTESKTVES